MDYNKVMEDDDNDSEDGHHVQPIFGETDHAPDCSARSDSSVAAQAILMYFMHVGVLVFFFVDGMVSCPAQVSLGWSTLSCSVVC